MAERKIKIDVEVQSAAKGQLATAATTAKGISTKDEVGKQRLTRINNLTSNINSFLQQSELTETEFKTFAKQLKQLAELTTQASLSLGKYSVEVKKQQEQIDKLQKRLDQSRQKRNELKERSVVSGGNVTAIRDDTLQQELAKLGISRVGGGAKFKTTSGFIKSYEENVVQGGKSVADVFKNPEAAQSFYEKYQQQLQEARETYAAADQEVAQFTEELKQANAALLQMTSKDAGTGSNEFIQASASQVAVNKSLSKQQDVLAEQKTQENAIKEAQELNVQFDKQNSTLGKAFKQFTLYAIALRTVKKALTEAVSTVTELDKAITEQAMVTGLAKSTVQDLVTQYQNLAIATGATTKEVASVTTEYLRQGKSTADALKLTEAAISAAKVAGISTADSVNYLTTALNGFGLSTEQAMKVSDKFAAVAATAATSYDEIATALSKVASQANLAGMSIDYTTALLAKGLETTREAPETIGTALKTVIARMRELTDYGATLEGDVDLNNVESQLAYIGIHLRDTNGELRSTEDVLDDLGRSWSTLNSNQQAAVAKALAGTRQQSRLIAMMDDYERVIELQEISARSAGATVAQMSTYLTGIEAHLNNISVAWEKIITNIVESDVVNSVLNVVSELLDSVATLLQHEVAVKVAAVAIGAIAINILATRKLQNDAAKVQTQLQVQEQVNTLKQAKAQKEVTLELQKQNVAQAKKLVMEAKEAYLKNPSAATKQEVQNAQKLLEQEQASYKLEKQKLSLDVEYQKTTKTLNALEGQNTSILSISTTVLVAKNIALGIQNLLTSIRIKHNEKMLKQSKEEITLEQYKTLLQGKWITNEMIKTAAQSASTAGTKAQAAADYQLAEAQIAVSATNPFLAIATAITVATAAVVGITAFIVKLVKKSKDPVKDIKNSANEIYTLNKNSTSIKSITDEFDALDNKILKTSEDLTAMSEALDGAADKLTEDQQKIYNSLSSDSSRRDYLDTVLKENETQIKKDNDKILEKMATSKAQRVLTGQSSDSVVLQDALKSINNTKLYSSIDEFTTLTTTESSAIRTVGQTILEALSPLQSYSAANSNAAKSLAAVLANNKELVSTLEDSGSTLVEQVEAYEQLSSLLSGSVRTAFESAYSQFEFFTSFGQEALDFIDNMGLSYDNIKDIAEAIQDLGYSLDESKSKFKSFIESVAEGGDLGQAIRENFSEVLEQYDANSKAWENAYNSILQAYESAVGTGILNMGQNIDSLQNTIASFYEKASEWSSLSNTERAEFISDNGEIFAGEDGTRILRAFESQNYALIQQALQQSEVLQSKLTNLVQDLETDLSIELSRAAEDQNKAYIKQLQSQLAMMKNVNNVFSASLELMLEQQDAELEAYKELLQQENDALTESLEKRKDAYQRYFDAINQQAEDQDYEDQANLLISNLARIGATSDMGSRKQAAELTTKLNELEAERMQELRERAQEQVIQSIDDQLDVITEKFDELIENNRALLAAMTSDLSDGGASLFAKMLEQQYTSGLTGLELQSWIQEFGATFGSITDLDLSGVNVGSSNGDLYLDVGGQTINLTDSDKQSLRDAIAEALRQIGTTI